MTRARAATSKRTRPAPPAGFAAAIFAILAGGEIHGITGMLIAIPLIPLIKETWLIFRRRLRFENWCATVTGSRAPGAGGLDPVSPGASSPGASSPAADDARTTG